MKIIYRYWREIALPYSWMWLAEIFRLRQLLIYIGGATIVLFVLWIIGVDVGGFVLQSWAALQNHFSWGWIVVLVIVLILFFVVAPARIYAARGLFDEGIEIVEYDSGVVRADGSLDRRLAGLRLTRLGTAPAYCYAEIISYAPEQQGAPIYPINPYVRLEARPVERLESDGRIQLPGRFGEAVFIVAEGYAKGDKFFARVRLNHDKQIGIDVEASDWIVKLRVGLIVGGEETMARVVEGNLSVDKSKSKDDLSRLQWAVTRNEEIDAAT